MAGTAGTPGISRRAAGMTMPPPQRQTALPRRNIAEEYCDGVLRRHVRRKKTKRMVKRISTFLNTFDDASKAHIVLRSNKQLLITSQLTLLFRKSDLESLTDAITSIPPSFSDTNIGDTDSQSELQQRSGAKSSESRELKNSYYVFDDDGASALRVANPGGTDCDQHSDQLGNVLPLNRTLIGLCTSEGCNRRRRWC